MSRLPALVIAPVLLAACQNVPSPPDLEPLEEPRALEAAPPRVSGAIPIDRSRERAFTTQGVAETPAIAPPPTAGAAGQAGDVTLNFVDTDIREIARTILGTTLKLNYTIDPNVHGTGSMDTGTPLPRSALLPTLETLLNANGATLVERNGVYAVVPIAAGNTTTAGARFPDTRARGARENTGLDPFGEIAGAWGWGGDFHSSFAGRNPPPHAREGSHSCFRSDGKPPR